MQSQSGGPVRSDLPPLLRRFPSLDLPRAASWQTGELGDSARNPGPSSYHLTAVVAVAPATGARLMHSGPQPAAAPVIPGVLGALLPSGHWYAGDALARELVAGSAEPVSVDAHLEPTANVVVLRVKGGN